MTTINANNNNFKSIFNANKVIVLGIRKHTLVSYKPKRQYLCDETDKFIKIVK